MQPRYRDCRRRRHERTARRARARVGPEVRWRLTSFTPSNAAPGRQPDGQRRPHMQAAARTASCHPDRERVGQPCALPTSATAPCREERAEQAQAAGATPQLRSRPRQTSHAPGARPCRGRTTNARVLRLRATTPVARVFQQVGELAIQVVKKQPATIHRYGTNGRFLAAEMTSPPLASLEKERTMPKRGGQRLYALRRPSRRASGGGPGHATQFSCPGAGPLAGRLRFLRRWNEPRTGSDSARKRPSLQVPERRASFLEGRGVAPTDARGWPRPPPEADRLRPSCWRPASARRGRTPGGG